jgi:translation elongation factor EF-Tu-like GTPase
MAARKKSGRRKYGKAASKSVESAMRRRKRGTLKAGRGRRGKVKSRKQAIAIGLSEARKKGAKVPPKKGRSSGRRKSSARRKRSSSKSRS